MIGVDVGAGAVSTGVSLKEIVGAAVGAHPNKRSPMKNDTRRIFIAGGIYKRYSLCSGSKYCRIR